MVLLYFVTVWKVYSAKRKASEAYILAVKLLDRYNLWKIMEKSFFFYMKCLILVCDKPSVDASVAITALASAATEASPTVAVMIAYGKC